jgi:hypothetical protein
MAIAKAISLHPSRAATVTERAPKPGRLLERFVIFEIVCQLALLSGALAQFRIFFRTGVFALSIGLLLLLPGRGRLHPAAKVAVFVLVLLVLGMVNPGVNSALSAAAQFAIYLAILAPLFWVSRVRIDLPEMRRVLSLQWGFQALSATVGVLQVYFPGRFQFHISQVVEGNGAGYMSMLRFNNAFGEMVYRPMGLTDTPGAAAGAGFIAVLFATAFLLHERRRWMQALYAATMLIGMAAIYLSQVRVMLLMELICMAAMVGLLTLRIGRGGLRRPGRVLNGRRLMALTGLMSLVVVLGFTWAVAVGGTAVSERINSLTASNPGEVYQQNRGQFLFDTFENVLPQYPLGAGPGRWGMMAYYFGNPDNNRNPFLYSEIQWTGWIYDGGIPLVFLYALALALAMRVAYKIALNQRFAELGALGALVFAYDLSALAATFDGNYFIGGAGLDFWLLNAMLFNAAYHTFRTSPGAVAEARR